MTYTILLNKNISVTEYSSLMESVGWGSHDAEHIRRSLAAYPFVVHARSATNMLVGYVSAFSDHAFSTMLGELVVHPSTQRQGIGRALLTAVEKAFPRVPVYVKPLGAAKQFFLACGYRVPRIEMEVLVKRNGVVS